MDKKDKIKDFLRIGEKELRGLLGEKREKIRSMKFDLASGKTKNAGEIRTLKRDIARILTVLNSKK